MALRRHSMWFDKKNLKALSKIGKQMGGLSGSAVARIAVQQFLDRHTAELAAPKIKPEG